MAIQTSRKRINSPTLHFYSPIGEADRLTYQLHIDDDGCECLVCTGQTNQYASIQSFREGCDLSIILSNIDPNSLANAVSTFSAEDLINSEISDYSVMPRDLGSMFNLVQKGENLFSGLPEEIRAEFNYSVKNFVRSFGTNQFNEIINKYVTAPSIDGGAGSAPEPIDESEVVSDE